MPYDTQFPKEEVKASIDRLPRVRLANLPTPLQEAPHLSEALGGPRILFKRDDLTGLALGGNKTRMLEFIVGEAMARGSDAVIIGARTQSNFCRQVAAAASKLDLQAILVLRKGEEEQPQGNWLLDILLGADIRLVPVTDPWDGAQLRRVATELHRQGRRPYVIDRSYEVLGMISYLNCAIELYTQLEELGTMADYLYVASSGPTQAGLMMGGRCLGAPFRVMGISYKHPKEEVQARVADIIGQGSSKLGLKLSVAPEEVISLDEYTKAGHGVLTPEIVEAIHLVARTEGILLDPIYTGKAMVGLIDAIREGRIGTDEVVAFVHTGGFPALFAYSRELIQYQKGGTNHGSR
jgi:1-aminocyclopropane-1-carboxylate deaminase/D-cysteine desulfhydrase-like pyridoxal-dependent ACC family enzyme